MKTEILLNRLKDTVNKTDDFKYAVKNLLQEICIYTNWIYGEAWFPNKSYNQMEFLYAWYDNPKIFSDYKKFTSICKFAEGVGLVGKSWKEKEPLWINDLSAEKDFIRIEPAEKAGFKSAFSLPFVLGEKKVLILIFFMASKNEKDEASSKTISLIKKEIEEILKEKFSI